MPMIRCVVGVLAAIVVASCVPAQASPAATSASPPSSTSPSSTAPSTPPSAAPVFQPGPGSVGGRITQFVQDGFAIDVAGDEVIVDTGLVVLVWKETSVPPSALNVGDDVYVNGTPGSPFVARYIWADTGTLFGYIREIDGAGMDLEVHAVQGAVMRERIAFSAYLELGAAGVATSRADLAVGRAIGAVIYRPRSGALRATKIWLE